MILLAGKASATVSKFAIAVPPALPDLVDDFFGGCGAIARTVGGYAGIIYDNFGTLCGTEKGDLATDATPGTRDDDDLVAQ
jgi:hypothetical protein